MKNLADDIIDLLNFIRPKDNMIKRDKIFSTEKKLQYENETGRRRIFKKDGKRLCIIF